MTPAPRAPAATIQVEVAYSPRPGEVDVVALQLPAGSTVHDAVRASGLVPRHGLDAQALRLGVWGKAKEAAVPLRERDRVEIYRPLRVDPKEARRQRYKRHLESVAARAARAKGPR